MKPYPGTVVSSRLTRVGSVELKISRLSSCVTGDKLATCHGQKGIVTVVKNEFMPYVEKDGFGYAEVVISSTSLMKRSTVSQLMEAAAGQEAYLRGTGPFIVPDGYDQDYANKLLDRAPEATYTILGSNVNPYLARAGSEPLACFYGRIRVLQSVFLTTDKLQYTKSKASTNTLVTRQGGSTGDSCSLGEMELQQLAASGCYKVIRELQMRSNMVVASVCKHCRNLTELCMCAGVAHSSGLPSTAKMTIPHATVQLARTLRVSSGLSIEMS